MSFGAFFYVSLSNMFSFAAAAGQNFCFVHVLSIYTLNINDVKYDWVILIRSSGLQALEYD